MKPFKSAAEALGYHFWFDRSLRLWTVSKEGFETQYFSKEYLIGTMGLAKFFKFMQTNDQIDG